MNVLSQFTDEGRWPGLEHYIDQPGVYAAGRLDRDSEGLLVLTDDGKLQARIASPKFKLPKRYLVQVEGTPDAAALAALRGGVALKDGRTQPAEAEVIYRRVIRGTIHQWSGVEWTCLFRCGSGLFLLQ